MSQDHSCVNTLTSVLAFLRAHPGRFFSIEEICQQIPCTLSQVQLALNILVCEEIVQKEGAVGGGTRYVWG